MIKVPLRYSQRKCGYALIDDDCEPLKDLGYYSVTLPRKLRRWTNNRPDIILATLREDTLALSRCRPFISLYGTQVLLVHLVARNELGQLVVREKYHPSKAPITMRSEINEIRGFIGRIVHANGDRIDCRRENLREL